MAQTLKSLQILATTALLCLALVSGCKDKSAAISPLESELQAAIDNIPGMLSADDLRLSNLKVKVPGQDNNSGLTDSADNFLAMSKQDSNLPSNLFNIMPGQSAVDSRDLQSVTFSVDNITNPPATPISIPQYQMIEAVTPLAAEKEPPLAPISDELMRTVNIKLLEKRFDAGKTRVYFTILLHNTVKDKGVNIRLYVFGYDRNDRLVQTNDTALYLQANEQTIQNFNYAVKEVSNWLITVRNR